MPNIGFWAVAGAGGGAAGAYELISTTVLGSTNAYVNFTSIASTYKHLQLRWAVRSARSGANIDDVYVGFNADSGTTYSNHFLKGNGSTVSSGSNVNSQQMRVGNATAATSTANAFNAGVLDILDYANTTTYKTVRCLNGQDGANIIELASGNWRNTAAITQVNIVIPYGAVAGSRFSLYGVKG